MKRFCLYVCAAFLLSSSTINAQELGIGGGLHHLSNGVELSYIKHLDKNWDFETGLRVMVNTYSLSRNRPNYSFYQNGYAMHFSEYFGLNFRINRKLIAYKWFRLDGMSNLFLTRHSLLARSTDLPTLDSTGWHLTDDIFYTNPALSIELTIGLKIKIAVNRKISIIAGSGVGAIWMNYKHETISKVSGLKYRTLQLDGPFVNKERGVFEMVGLDGIPIMFLGLTYSFE